MGRDTLLERWCWFASVAVVIGELDLWQATCLVQDGVLMVGMQPETTDEWAVVADLWPDAPEEVDNE